MMTKEKDGYHFDFTSDEIIDSMAQVKALRDFCKTLPEDGAKETVKALQIAFEVMMVYWAINYGEEKEEEKACE